MFNKNKKIEKYKDYLEENGYDVFPENKFCYRSFSTVEAEFTGECLRSSIVYVDAYSSLFSEKPESFTVGIFNISRVNGYYGKYTYSFSIMGKDFKISKKQGKILFDIALKQLSFEKDIENAIKKTKTKNRKTKTS